MQVHAIQLDIQWEDRDANHERVRALVAQAHPEPGDLLVLPEMFSSGFSMNVGKVAQDGTRATEEFLSQLAKTHLCNVVGGVVNRGVKAGRNEAVAFNERGELVVRYAKHHLFPLADEHRHYEPGSEIVLFDWQGIKVCPLICYDLRFPELFRQAMLKGAEMILVIANWPEARISHWTALLQARAIENLCYVVGVNRVGNDPKLCYTGQSRIIDPTGKIIADAGSGQKVVAAPIDVVALRDYRKTFPVLDDIRADLLRP